MGQSLKTAPRAPDGNRTIYVYQLVMRLTSGFASGKRTFFVFYASSKGIMIKHSCAILGTIPRSIIESLKRHLLPIQESSIN